MLWKDWRNKDRKDQTPLFYFFYRVQYRTLHEGWTATFGNVKRKTLEFFTECSTARYTKVGRQPSETWREPLWNVCRTTGSQDRWRGRQAGDNTQLTDSPGRRQIYRWRGGTVNLVGNRPIWKARSSTHPSLRSVFNFRIRPHRGMNSSRTRTLTPEGVNAGGQECRLKTSAIPSIAPILPKRILTVHSQTSCLSVYSEAKQM
jgi:hypothetical protein